MKLHFSHLESLKLFTPFLDGTYSFLILLLLWPLPPWSLSWAPLLLGLSLKVWPSLCPNLPALPFSQQWSSSGPTIILRPPLGNVLLLPILLQNHCDAEPVTQMSASLTTMGKKQSWEATVLQVILGKYHSFQSSKLLPAGWYPLTLYFQPPNLPHFRPL